ncbi:MAG: cell wall-active antibiotics response protein [Bacteroidetes bacterium]|nr:cell wall-active antibiotics response protein [Bacteroidota bacterium]MBU1577976.1 cell wall-active antibiotics response protein [Bacteroidota bacterium]MBU2465422.1 cell wall-active antibiotics response protein [Bacteroidota bacterium]
MENSSNNLDRRVVAGILLIAAGGLLLLDQLDLLSFNLSYYLISWKTLLIGIGLITLSNKENRTTGIVLIGLGVLFWLPELLDYRVRFSTIFWPAILIGIGLIILTRRDGGSNHKQHHVFSGQKNPRTHMDEYIDEMAIFGGGNTRITSEQFRGGKITAVFGGSDVEMKTAVPAQEGCVIDAFILFGGTNLIVPDDWKVKSEVVSIFGGFSDKRIITANQDAEKTLLIKGVVIFGGIELKSY